MLVEKHTVETFAKQHNLTRQSAINLLSKLKAQGIVHVSGGGQQKRIYSVFNIPQKQTNGFYDVVNKYSPEKLIPKYKHYTYGTYTIEHAIIDGIRHNDVRTTQATTYLFLHITNWQRLFSLARKHNCTEKVYSLYDQARRTTRTKTMPKKYRRKK